MSLRSYALKCAAHIDYGYRATDDGNKELPKNVAPVVEPDLWCKETIEKYEVELSKWEELKKNPERLKEEYEAEKKERESHIHRWDEYALEREELKKRYETMLATVNSWHPGKDYDSLKKIMIEQIEKSIEHDCSYVKPCYAELEPMDEWVENNIELVLNSIAFYKKQWEAECKQVEEANKYLKGLYEELDKFKMKKTNVGCND